MTKNASIYGPFSREFITMDAGHVALALLVPLLWGAQYAVIKVGLAIFPPFFFAGLRFAVIALLLIPIVDRLKKSDIGPLVLISIFMGGINFGGAFLGLTHSSAGIAGIANQLWTPFTLLLAWPMLGERPTLRVTIGLIIAFCGLALAVIDPTSSVPPVPTLLVVGSAVGLATGNVLTKRFGPFDPLYLFAWMSLFTALQLLLLSLFMESGQTDALVKATSAQWAAFGFTVLFGGIAAFGVWFWLIARFAVARVAPYALLQSFFSIAAGILFRGEPLTAALLIGAVICASGVAISQLSISRKKG